VRGEALKKKGLVLIRPGLFIQKTAIISIYNKIPFLAVIMILITAEDQKGCSSDISYSYFL